MDKSKRIYILNDQEIDSLYGLPHFSADEREIFFSLNESESKVLAEITSISTKIHFILCLGCFKAKQRLFQYDYSSINLDVKFIILKYFPNMKISKYFLSNADKASNNKRILELCSFKEFNANIKKSVIEYLISLARRLICHITIFSELVSYLSTRNIILPPYSTLQDLVSLAINIEERRLKNIIEKELTRELDLHLDNMLTQDENLGLLSFKKIPKDFKYRALKAEINKGETFRPVYFFAKQFLKKLEISEYNIRYYALVAERYNIAQLKKLKHTTTKLYLLCYIYYRYQQINDNILVCYNYYTDKFEKESKLYVMQKLLEHSKSYQENLPKVSKLLRFIGNENMEAMERSVFYQLIYEILPKQDYYPTADYLDGISFDEKQVKWDYYSSVSNKIKKYYRPMFKHLDFDYEKQDMAIVSAIKFLKEEFNKSKVLLNMNSTALPIGFISKKDRKYLKFEKDGRITYEPSKYEIYTYFALSKVINKGKVYCNESVKHKSLKSDLISDEIWVKKDELLKSLGYPRIEATAKDRLKELAELLHDKILRVNERIASNENKYFKKDGNEWFLEYPSIGEEINHKFFHKIQKKSIVDVIHFVNRQTNFSDAFTHIRTKHAKQKPEDNYIIACIIANGLSFGMYPMSQTCDINVHTLFSYEKNFLRIETLKKANDLVVNKIASLGIYREWQLLIGRLLGGVDGQKYESKFHTIESRYSPKYLGLRKGLVALNLSVNHAVINSKVISPNEHESHFLFDIVYNNTSDIDPDAITGDMHSINCLNYVILDAIDKSFMPNFNNPQGEAISCMKALKIYNECFLKPKKVINEKLIEDNWDDIQRVLASLVIGNTSQSIIVSKLSSSKRHNKIKRALNEYNDIMKSLHLLDFIDDSFCRSSIRSALNRTESYHKLRKAIVKVGGGKFIGKSVVENEIWNQCTRLIANCIIYYNALLLDQTMSVLKIQNANEDYLKCIKSISPVAWININLTGKYEFTGAKGDINIEKFVEQIQNNLNDKTDL